MIPNQNSKFQNKPKFKNNRIITIFFELKTKTRNRIETKPIVKYNLNVNQNL